MALTIHKFLIDNMDHEQKDVSRWTERLLGNTLLSDKLTFGQVCLIEDALGEAYRAGAIDAFNALKN